MGGVQGPLMGYCTDRFGPRVMLAFGGLMSGLGFILLARTTNFWWFLLVFVVFLSVGFRSGYNNASIAAVNNWFRRRRGLAMSVVSMGNGLGGASAYLVGLLIFVVGWRDACTILGILILAVVIPLSWFLRRAPEDMGLLPDGDPPEMAEAASSGQQRTRQRRNAQAGETDFTAKEAMVTPSYWLLVMATGFRNIVHAGASFLMAPLIIWFLEAGVPVDPASDLGRQHIIIAAGFVSAFSFANMVFNPCVGWLGDRVDRRKLSALCMVSGALALGSLITGKRRNVAGGGLRPAAGLCRKRQPPQLGHHGRLLRPARLRKPCAAGSTCPTSWPPCGRPCGWAPLRLHQQLLLGAFPVGRPLHRRCHRLLVPAPSAAAQTSGIAARTGRRAPRPRRSRHTPAGGLKPVDSPRIAWKRFDDDHIHPR